MSLLVLKTWIGLEIYPSFSLLLMYPLRNFQSPEGVPQKKCSELIFKTHKKYSLISSSLSKVMDYRPATLLSMNLFMNHVFLNGFE